MSSLARDVFCSSDDASMTATLTMTRAYNRLILIKPLLNIDVAYFE
jgi:hypothetical protein